MDGPARTEVARPAVASHSLDEPHAFLCACNEEHSRFSFLVSRAGVVRTAAPVILGILVFVGWSYLADARVTPKPGIRSVVWRTERDLTSPVDPDRKVQKFYIRPARAYEGPPLSDGDLAMFQANGHCDALARWLREPWKSTVRSAVSGFEEVLVVLGDSCDEAIEEAKKKIRGTSDEYVRRDPSNKAEPGLVAFLANARNNNSMSVSDSFDGAMRHYQIRRSLHPRVYELREQDAEVNGQRGKALHSEVVKILQREGRKILDESAMQKSWDAILDEAAR